MKVAALADTPACDIRLQDPSRTAEKEACDLACVFIDNEESLENAIDAKIRTLIYCRNIWREETRILEHFNSPGEEFSTMMTDFQDKPKSTKCSSHHCLLKDFIEPTKTQLAARIVFARKKDGTARFCVDY